MKFHPTRARTFSIHIADDKSKHPGEPVFDVTCEDSDGDKRPVSFYSSNALTEDEVDQLKLLLDKISAYAISELTD
jgi:hypothetical protein